MFKARPSSPATKSRTDGFDEDELSQLLADSQAGIADLANEIGVASEQFDLLLLADTEFAEPRGDIRRGGKLFDADDGAGFYAAQWANP